MMRNDKRKMNGSPSLDTDPLMKIGKTLQENEYEADSTGFERGTQENEDFAGNSENVETEKENGENGSNENKDADADADNSLVISQDTAAKIHLIQEKMELFTQQVSGLLEAGKTFFTEIANQFEERICMIHQEQMSKWQEEIQWLREMDSVNENINSRIHNALVLIHGVQTNA